MNAPRPLLLSFGGFVLSFLLVYLGVGYPWPSKKAKAQASAPQGSSPPAPAAPAPVSSLPQPPSAPDPALPRLLITPDSLGPIRLGMTLEEAGRAIPEARLKRTSDGDGAALVAVEIGGQELMVLFADEEDPEGPIDGSKRIEVIETFSPSCSTALGIHPGSSIADAEKAMGPTVRILKSEIESREYIAFRNQPPHTTFRLDYTGIFPEGSNETTRYQPEAKIFSIAISARGGFAPDPEPPKDALR